MKILFVGDVVAEVGRKALSKNLPFVLNKTKCDFVVVNVENIAYGHGINKTTYDFLCDLPIDCMTLGNHYRDNIEVLDILSNDNIIRPLNIKRVFPGKGSNVYLCKGKKIRITNVLGLSFMKEKVEEPYKVISKLIENDDSDIHIVDYHAESTGEKKSFAYYFSNKLGAVIGTHTHVQTADNQILNNNTAFISDVGMCGSYNSVLGNEINSVIKRTMFHDRSVSFEYLDSDDTLFNAVIIEFDDKTNKAIKIERINLLNGKDNG